MKVWDQKMVRIRNDLDVHVIVKSLEKKADTEDVKNDFSNHEFKICTLDRNIVKIATDIQTFQTAINQLHKFIIELQEANRDVLFGKKSINCLSCGTGNKQNYSKGRDGKLYKGIDVETTISHGHPKDDSYVQNPSRNTNYLDNLGSPSQEAFRSANIVTADLASQTNKLLGSKSFYEECRPQYNNLNDVSSTNLPSVIPSISKKGSISTYYASNQNKTLNQQINMGSMNGSFSITAKHKKRK